MDAKQVIKPLLKWWWLIAISVVGAGVASFLAMRSLPPVYRATATLMIGPGLEQANPNTYQLYASRELALTYAEMARRSPVLEGVISDLALETTPQVLAGQISVNLVGNTQLLELSVVDVDPAMAQQIANGVANRLIQLTPGLRDDEDQIFVEQQIENIRSQIERAEEELEDLDAEFDQANTVREMEAVRGQRTVLQQQLNEWRYNVTMLMQLQSGNNINSLRIIEAAPFPIHPIGSSSFTNVALAVAVAGVLSGGAALFLDFLDDTIKSEIEVAQQLDLPTLGMIGRVSSKGYEDILDASNRLGSPTAEAYRALRTNILFTVKETGARVWLITSASPSEGKTVTASNIGVSMAQAGYDVVLIDTDLRRPALHRVFGGDNRGPGVTGALRQALASLSHIDILERSDEERPQNQDVISEDDVLELLVDTPEPRLKVLLSGPLPVNATELVGSAGMRWLLEQLKKHFDFVLLDSPPVLAVADTMALASVTEGALLVIDAGKTRRGAAKRAVETLQQVGAKVNGVILNRVKASDSGGYYYYYYSSRYGYDTRSDNGKGHRSAKTEAAQTEPQQDRDG